MTRPPDLPPRNRGAAVQRLTSSAALGRLELPVCQQCGQVQYPVRELCRSCLSDSVRWEEVCGAGTLLATTVLHHSIEPYFLPLLPFGVGSVRLDVGPVALAFIVNDCGPAGTRVRLVNNVDRAGQSVLTAVPERRGPQEISAVRDPTREITGKVVLLTGASGGIGRALTEAFLTSGAAEVIAAARTPPEPAAGVRPVVLDVTDQRAVTALARECADTVDIVVNNAGVNFNLRILDPDADAARKEIEVNYLGTLNMIRAFAPSMKRRGQGLMLNMLTVLGYVNLPTMGSYCASKAAAVSVTQAARAELAPWGIRVCGVFPTAVDTPMSAHLSSPKMSPRALAAAVVDAIRGGVEDSYPGAAEDLRTALRDDPKSVERRMAARLPVDELPADHA